MCHKTLTIGKKRLVFLHTALGTLQASIQTLRCQHRNAHTLVRCETRVSFNYYVYIGKKIYFTNTVPHYILVGKSHLFDTHYIKLFAVQQFMHGNGTHLLAKQANIAGQHRLTPTLKAILQGFVQIVPNVTSDTLGEALKIWMMIRYLSTHNPIPINLFDKKSTIQEIISQARLKLQNFQFRPHAPSTAYCCTENTFIVDGTCKINFKVCSVPGCMNGLAPKRTVCTDHLQYKGTSTAEVTGIYKIVTRKIRIYVGGIYNILCECGSPIAMKPYKGGESILDVLYFVEQSLRVSLFRKFINIM